MSSPAFELGSPLTTVQSLGLPPVRGEEEHVQRIAGLRVGRAAQEDLATATRLGVTREFVDVVTYFPTQPGHTPPGFRVELRRTGDGVVLADLVRDIAFGADSEPRPTKLLFSADTANPRALKPVAPLLANLTCDLGLVDGFLNDAAANGGGEFRTRDEVLSEIGRVLGPGADVCVALENPFDPDFARILDEAEKYREILSRWRVVITVPPTGPVNASNATQLLSGDGRLDRRWSEASPEDAFAGHHLALKLREQGFRVNFTLMFEPHQAQLALQARPSFVTCLVGGRFAQTTRLAQLLARYEATRQEEPLVELRAYLLAHDHLASGDAGCDLADVRATAERLVRYRRFHSEGDRGLDGVRHNLRALRQANLPETRLIVGSLDGDALYPDLDLMLAEPEFADLVGRVVVTAEPASLAQFASSSHVVSHQRRLLGAARGQG